MLDLEDAVGPDLKSVARRNVGRWLSEGGDAVIRINGADSVWYKDDVAMLSGHRCAVILPKVSKATQIGALLDQLPGVGVVPLLETAEGILNAREVCSAEGVIRSAFGNADLALDLGIDVLSRTALSHARVQVVLASAAAKIAPPLDGPTVLINDEQRLLADTQHSAELGFTGRVCIHPRQVAVVNGVFMPTTEDLDWAREVVAAAGDGTVAVLANQMIATPLVNRARQILSRWGR
jgi:citrate lyase subunit beta/citryl-CoA lyase